jgi:hypothetical protein
VNGIFKEKAVKVVSPRKAIPKLSFTLQTLCVLMMEIYHFSTAREENVSYQNFSRFPSTVMSFH